MTKCCCNFASCPLAQRRKEKGENVRIGKQSVLMGGPIKCSQGTAVRFLFQTDSQQSVFINHNHNHSKQAVIKKHFNLTKFFFFNSNYNLFQTLPKCVLFLPKPIKTLATQMSYLKNLFFEKLIIPRFGRH